MDVALVTSSALPDLSEDDRLLADALTQRGADVRAVVWDDKHAAWTAFGVAVVRSTWDYERRRDAFVIWAHHAARRTRLWNPADVLEDNTDKRYLRRLAEAGVPVVETAWIGADEPLDLGSILDRHGWDRVVVKPTISGGARDTALIGPHERGAGEALVDRILLSGRQVMVQPFLDAVVQTGEFSIVCVDGRPTHAVLKRPAPGDWRVQRQWGGSAARVPLTDGLAELAGDALAALGAETLYARVDVVADRPGGVMEVELTEPALFLRHSAEAVARLADATLARIPV
jgi:glutathione synthase/RimK-type ligase-like ATP-grasp enzyme